MIVNTGYELLADVLTGNSAIAYCGVGSGTTPVTSADTGLETPIGERQVVTMLTRVGPIFLASTYFPRSSNLGTWNEAVLSTTLTGDIISRVILDPPYIKINLKSYQLDIPIRVIA